MKIELFTIVLILKTFLLSQIGVEAGTRSKCKTDNDCRKQFDEVCYLDTQGTSAFCQEQTIGKQYGYKRV